MYQEAEKVSVEDILEFGCNVNEYLADENGRYQFDWDKKDAAYIKNEIHSVVDKILSTGMRNPISFELSNLEEEYDEAFKNGDISSCMDILTDLMMALSMLHALCESINREV